jgi:hypothetical protein
LNERLRQQLVTVNRFPGITDEENPRERTVSRHFFVLTVGHGGVIHSDLWGEGTTEVELGPTHWKVGPSMAWLKRSVLNWLAKSKRQKKQRKHPNHEWSVGLFVVGHHAFTVTTFQKNLR